MIFEQKLIELCEGLKYYKYKREDSDLDFSMISSSRTTIRKMSFDFGNYDFKKKKNKELVNDNEYAKFHSAKKITPYMAAKPSIFFNNFDEDIKNDKKQEIQKISSAKNNGNSINLYSDEEFLVKKQPSIEEFYSHIVKETERRYKEKKMNL